MARKVWDEDIPKSDDEDDDDTDDTKDPTDLGGDGDFSE